MADVTLLYFSWVKDRIGKGEENLTLPKQVQTISQLIDHLANQSEGYAAAFADQDKIRAALNEETVPLDTRLADGDELALFPPMTGGQNAVPFKVRVQSEDFDIAAELGLLEQDNPQIGATACFSGRVRLDDGPSPLLALHLDHYQSMAEKALRDIGQQALDRWPLLGLTIIHRFGTLKIGEQIVLVAATSSHRQAAFEAAQFIMDYLKTDAPFWKREERADGSTNWVEAKAIDDSAKDRWSAE
mgnify:CR=1 FL=1